MQRFGLILWIISLVLIIPNDSLSGGGSKPAAPPPLTISSSTKDVFYVNLKVKFTASGGHGDNRFSTNFGSINTISGDYTAPNRSGTASITVRDKKGNTATYRVPVYYRLGITPSSANVPTGGSASFRGTGGIAPYKYSTNKGGINTSGTFWAPSSTGTATITVTDYRNNKATAKVTIYQSLGITPTHRNLMVNSSSSFSAIGGWGSKGFSTNKGSINSGSGSYKAPSSTGNGTVTVSDSRGAKATAGLNVYPALTIGPKNLTLPINGRFHLARPFSSIWIMENLS